MNKKLNTASRDIKLHMVYFMPKVITWIKDIHTVHPFNSGKAYHCFRSFQCWLRHTSELHTCNYTHARTHAHTHAHTHTDTIGSSSWHPQSVTAKTQRTSSSSQEGRDSTLSSAEFELIKTGNDRLPAMTDIFFTFYIFHSWGYLVSLVGGMKKGVCPVGQIWIVFNHPSWDTDWIDSLRLFSHTCWE